MTQKPALYIQMKTPRGTFYWNGAAMYARGKAEEEGLYRLWGWYSTPNAAQQYKLKSAATKVATALYYDLSRLHQVQIDVVKIEQEIIVESTPIGTYFDR